MTRDRRLTPARPDVAAAHLAGKVEAERFAEPVACRVRHDRVALRPRADPDLPPDTELLFGEPFELYDTEGGWAWGQSGLDGYVGYLPEDALVEADGPPPSHIVRTLGAQLYRVPALKSPAAGTLPFAARVRVSEERDGFARVQDGLWVPPPQLRSIAAPEGDWVAVAERFIGVPYVWGGRSSAGLDCSALVQLARQSAGAGCPRDSDMQQAGPGRAIAPDAPLARGDLVFWKGHVGIMVDAAMLLHANAHHMAVALEPLAGAVRRIEAAGGGPPTRRVRLDAEPGKD